VISVGGEASKGLGAGDKGHSIAAAKPQAKANPKSLPRKSASHAARPGKVRTPVVAQGLQGGILDDLQHLSLAAAREQQRVEAFSEWHLPRAMPEGQRRGRFCSEAAIKPAPCQRIGVLTKFEGSSKKASHRFFVNRTAALPK
jgi:hypothetical protein